MTIDRRDTREERGHLDDLKIPRSIHVQLDKDFIGFTANDDAICKFAIGDTDTIFTAVRLLNGILSAQLGHAEVEHLRDLLLEVVGS